jgi:hypothetical protein
VQAGLPAGFHFHDLRHTGNNLAAASGASTRELMHRVGHGSMRAALIYQHATGERDREIADALQFRIERELKEMGPIEGPRLRVGGPSLGQAPQKERGDEAFAAERVTRIELAWPAWKNDRRTAALPWRARKSVRESPFAPAARPGLLHADRTT